MTSVLQLFKRYGVITVCGFASMLFLCEWLSSCNCIHGRGFIFIKLGHKSHREAPSRSSCWSIEEMPISEYLECVWTWNAAESRGRNKTCPKSILKCSDRGFDQAERCLPLTGWRCSSSWRCSSERWDFCSRCSPAGPSTGCWPSSPAAGRWKATQEEEEGTAAGRYFKNRTLGESLC